MAATAGRVRRSSEDEATTAALRQFVSRSLGPTALHEHVYRAHVHHVHVYHITLPGSTLNEKNMARQ